METWALLPHRCIKLNEYCVNPDDLVKLDILVAWLNGFESAKSGKIEGHFELAMHLRSLVSQYLAQKEVNNGS